MHLDTQVEAHLEIPQPVCPALSLPACPSVCGRRKLSPVHPPLHGPLIWASKVEWEWICSCNWSADFLQMYISRFHFKVLIAKIHWTCFGTGPFLMDLNPLVSQMPTLYMSSVRVTSRSPLLYVSFHFSCTSSPPPPYYSTLEGDGEEGSGMEAVSLLSVDFS